MEPKVALTTAPTAKLLCAEILGRSTKGIPVDNRTRYSKKSKSGPSAVAAMPGEEVPGNAHANVIGQRHDGDHG